MLSLLIAPARDVLNSKDMRETDDSLDERETKTNKTLIKKQSQQRGLSKSHFFMEIVDHLWTALSRW